MGHWIFLIALSIQGAPSVSGHLSSPLLSRPAAEKADSSPSVEACRAQLGRYLEAAVLGLEAMRGADGMLRDTVRVIRGDHGIEVQEYKNEVAPTDIALDLLVQLGLGDFPQHHLSSQSRLQTVLDTLARWPREPKTGLFFRLYENGSPKLTDLSSVDNIHLALALWTVAHSPGANPKLAETAGKILDSMDFSLFFDVAAHRVGGNMKAGPDGSYALEPYRYHLGSEARSVLILGWALSLFRSVSDKDVLQALKETPLPEENGQLLFWDGGLFQALLPTLLVDESKYSSHYQANHHSLLDQFLESASATRLASGSRIFVPLAPSASLVSFQDGELIYSGKVGLEGRKDPTNSDSVLENLVVPHGALLTALASPCAALEVMKPLENATTAGVHFFEPKLGWMAAGEIDFTEGSKTLRPIPGLVGVDKGIEALSLLQALSSNGQPSARALARSPQVTRRLQTAYSILNSRLAAPPSRPVGE